MQSAFLNNIFNFKSFLTDCFVGLLLVLIFSSDLLAIRNILELCNFTLYKSHRLWSLSSSFTVISTVLVSSLCEFYIQYI